jgi:hypothetical protein
MEIRTKFPQKTKNRTAIGSSYHTPIYIIKGMKGSKLQTATHPYAFISVLFKTTKLWNQPTGLSTYKLIKKM